MQKQSINQTTHHTIDKAFSSSSSSSSFRSPSSHDYNSFTLNSQTLSLPFIPSSMASFLLPQALIAVPSNQSIQIKNQLGFSLDAVRRLSAANSRAISLSTASSSNISSSIFGVPSRNSFVVRSEAGSGDAPVDGGENDDGVEAEAVVVEEEETAESEVAQTESRPPRQPRVKMGEIMGILNKKAIEASEEQRPVPDIRTGDIVEIKLEVPENRRRLSVYKGIVISKQNAGIHTTMRIRRIIAGVGVEIVFPLYSPNIKEIKVVAHRKVRKARLYYLREKLPRLSTFK